MSRKRQRRLEESLGPELCTGATTSEAALLLCLARLRLRREVVRAHVHVRKRGERRGAGTSRERD